jgi:hypothetical protein
LLLGCDGCSPGRSDNAEDIFARRLRDGGEKSDPWYLPRLLLFARERRREEAEGNGANEGAAVHYSMT